MSHYKTELAEYGDLTTNYPYSPTNLYQSFTDFLETRWSEGWELVCASFDTGASHFRCVFKANGQP